MTSVCRGNYTSQSAPCSRNSFNVIIIKRREINFFSFSSLSIQNQQFELDLLIERSQEVLRLADANNKKTIEAQISEISAEWKELVSGLEGRRDALEALSKHWEDLEAQWSLIETKVTAIEEKGKLLDTVVRSKQHLYDTIKSLHVSVMRNIYLIYLRKE